MEGEDFESAPIQGPVDVTVAVTTCGRPAALLRCLEGLARGSVLPGEIIVVDQAPSEDSRAAAERAGLRVRRLEQPRLGVSAARNLALKSATGAVLALTDDDCVPDALWVEALTAAFSRDPAPVAVTGPIMPLGPAPEGMYHVSGRPGLRAREFHGRVLPWHVGSGGNFAARVGLLRSHGGWDERLGPGSPGRASEDADLFYRLLQAGVTLCYEPGAMIRHEWQTWERRLSTRRDYGFGLSAMCGLSLGRREGFALRMLVSYVSMHVRKLARGLRARDRTVVAQHARALTSVPGGLLYGLRAGRRRAAPSIEAGPVPA